LVEVVLGSQRFDIDELLIVEEEEESEDIFDGFLNNLGSEISASFVKKGYQKPKPSLEVPSLVIEKVGIDSKEPMTTFTEDTPFQYKETSDNIEDYFMNLSTIINNSTEPKDEDFMDSPVNEGILTKFAPVNENDQDTLRTAMSLKYKCPYCQKPMSTLNRVKSHSINCLKNTKNARCFVCNKKFQNRQQLLKHLKEEHLEVQGKMRDFEKSTRFKCTICDKSFRSTGNYSYHMRKHKGRQYSCEFCEKRFYTQSQVKSHLQSHNKEATKVVCPVCGKGFHYQSGLYYHMKMHTNERNKKCKYCPRRFYTSNSVKRHELTHTGARPYACNYCEKKFRSVGEVNKHTFLHTGERPYSCKYCDMGFTQMHNLKMHLMTHPGEHWCETCSKGFAEKEILKFHMRNKHGGGAITAKENKQLMKKDVFIEKDEEQESDVSVEKDEDSDEGYFLGEDFEKEDESEMTILKTYELRDEVLVETVEETY